MSFLIKDHSVVLLFTDFALGPFFLFALGTRRRGGGQSLGGLGLLFLLWRLENT